MYLTIKEFLDKYDWSRVTIGKLRISPKFGRRKVNRYNPYNNSTPWAHEIIQTIFDGKGLNRDDRQMLCAAIAGYNDMPEYWNTKLRKNICDRIRRAKNRMKNG